MHKYLSDVCDLDFWFGLAAPPPILVNVWERGDGLLRVFQAPLPIPQSYLEMAIREAGWKLLYRVRLRVRNA